MDFCWVKAVGIAHGRDRKISAPLFLLPISCSITTLERSLRFYKFASPRFLWGVTLGKAPTRVGEWKRSWKKKMVVWREGGGRWQGNHSYVHLQCLMNDEDNDWWYLGGLGENSWVVLSKHAQPHSRTAAQPRGFRHDRSRDETVKCWMDLITTLSLCTSGQLCSLMQKLSLCFNNFGISCLFTVVVLTNSPLPWQINI